MEANVQRDDCIPGQPRLFMPYKLRAIEFRNRVFVSPMCQYSCVAHDGMPTTWHMVHLGSRAVGGAGMVFTEAAAVSPEGRISPSDAGMWHDQHQQAWAPIAAFIKEHGAVPGIQLAHAGRKASTREPWNGDEAPIPPDDPLGWVPIAPSPVRWAPGYTVPREMNHEGMQRVKEAFVAATKRSVAAGFEVVELHYAHGYLVNEFLDPLTNHRTDEYGGSLENRMRYPLEVAAAVRKELPEDLPLFVRISGTDYMPGGWGIDDSIAFCRELKQLGVDLIDCSSGAVVRGAKIRVGPGYQVPIACAVRDGAGIPTGAVGMIYEPHQAEEILCDDKADVVFIAREFLRTPYWPLKAATALGVDIPWPVQYDRAKPPIVPPVPADAVVIVNKVEDNKHAAKDVMHPAGVAESGEGHHDKPATPVRGKA